MQEPYTNWQDEVQTIILVSMVSFKMGNSDKLSERT